MRMILVYGVCFLLVFLGAGLCGQAADTTLTPPVHNLPNVAHRGASYSYPENTIAAYRAAINAGANGAECDVYKTADNALVLSHDRTTKRTMGGENKDITKLTLEEIRKLDAGIWKGKDFKGEKVPTLEEYLLLLKNTTCRPVIEIKMEGIETLVIDAVRKQNMIKDTTIISFSATVIKEVRKHEPAISVAWLYGGSKDKNPERVAAFLIEQCKDIGVVIVDLNHGLVSAELVVLLKKAGLHVWCWTVNDPKRMNELLDWGVESITTDRPDVLNEVLKKR